MTASKTAHVPLPDLQFDADGHPSSQAFGDVYFSRSGGVEETEYVFLRGNGLPERFADAPNFTIGELGFGSGLNFLVAAESFLRNTRAHQHLHYFAVEKYPCTPAMLAHMHASLPDNLQPLLQELLKYYPLRLPGWHRVQLDRVTLTLGFGDALELLQATNAQADAWFIDGFSPAKNPEMWSKDLLAQVARLSAPGATLATFTAAGAVKRHLQAHGFTMQKTKGFARKREMLVGRFTGDLNDILQLTPEPSVTDHPIIVVGAGIAGATAAHALADRGYKVLVLEKDDIACAASGNPAAVLYPQLSKHYTHATAWHFSGYSLMLRQLARWRAMGYTFAGATPGMLRLPRPDQSAADYAQLELDDSIAHYVTREEASARVGAEVVSDGWWFAHGTWVAPKELCQALLTHPNITCRIGAEVNALLPVNEQGGWRVMLTDGEVLRADKLVVANAQNLTSLLPDYTLPMGVSAGQISMMPLHAAEPSPQCILSYLGYLIPCSEQLLMGATYDHDDFSCAVTAANHAENVAHARAAFHGWKLQGEPMEGRTSLRATTPDHLPYVGALAPGLYVSVGHGSRGLISAPLAAEVIASHIHGEPQPVATEILRAVSPLRRHKTK